MIILIDAIARELSGVTHMVVFTDSDPAAAAINTGNSPSPQIDFLMEWLQQRQPGIQFLAIHVPGVSNQMSDALSRDKWHGAVASVEAGGVKTHRMRPADECSRMTEHASSLPQRGTPH